MSSPMDKEKECKICSKRFSNGKALGGHMRSHSSKFSLLPNSKPMPTPTPTPTPTISSDCLSSSSNSSNLQAPPPNSNLIFTDRRSKGKQHRDKHSDDELETTTIWAPPHSNLIAPRHRDDEAETSMLSSLSMEDAAWCLLRMKGGGIKRMKLEESKPKENQNEFVRDYEEEFECKAKEDEEEKEESLTCKFKCKKCKKGFSSYQALGGHNASHRRLENYNGEVQQKVFKCSLCPRVFVSGQALGGHKKVHFSIMNNNNNNNNNYYYYYFNNSQPHRFAKTLVDLNRPPPYGDYDEDEEDQYSEIFNPC